MSITYDKIKLNAKAEQYCERNNTTVTQELGYGTQGVVFKTAHNTAIKAYDLAEGYHREVNIYKRLKERNIQSIRGLNIPRVVNWDDELYIFEMSIVHVPCVLDFGGAYLDAQPDHMVRDEIWFSQKQEEFGNNWEEAQAVIRELEYRAGIWLSDVNTGNIKFAS
jgi:hypothetical protein